LQSSWFMIRAIWKGEAESMWRDRGCLLSVGLVALSLFF
jgi:hypothetical protein